MNQGYVVKWSLFAITVFVAFIRYVNSHAHGINSRDFDQDLDPFRHREVLDSKGNYVLEWRVDWEERRVIFNVTVQAKGYVGFGLAKEATMVGADIVIGGVDTDGTPYFSDRHATSNKLPEVDSSQDWTLDAATETGSVTQLTFSRPFDTCDDPDDTPITDERIWILWAYGENDDDIQYHFENRGVFQTYLLDPDLTPRNVVQSGKRTPPGQNLGQYRKWSLERTEILPAQDTIYNCFMFKGPSFPQKQHIVGFNPVVNVDGDYIHHFLLYRCYPPPGVNATELYSPFVNGPGQECNIIEEPIGPMPTHHCQETIYVWARGGRSVFFPDHAGLPTSENPEEYYSLQVHYDNPKLIPELEVNFDIEVFYTGNLRQYDADLLGFGHQFPSAPSIMLPPSSVDHYFYGHCAAECTQTLLPEEGINVFGVLMHTHLAGRGARVEHIRGNIELPAISYDDNYRTDYQQTRILKDEVVMLPGDMITHRCEYDTTDRNGSVTVGGLPTKKEMCDGVLWYYPKLPRGIQVCRSEIRSRDYGNFLGILATNWSNTVQDFVVTDPEENEGLTVTQVGNSIDWTIEKREDLQKYHKFGHHVSFCPTIEQLMDQAHRLPSRSNEPQAPRRTPTNSFTNPTPDELRQDYDHFSVFPPDLVPYERPRMCPKN